MTADDEHTLGLYRATLRQIAECCRPPFHAKAQRIAYRLATSTLEIYSPHREACNREYPEGKSRQPSAGGDAVSRAE